jgi:hypothetical protein
VESVGAIYAQQAPSSTLAIQINNIVGTWTTKCSQALLIVGCSVASDEAIGLLQTDPNGDSNLLTQQRTDHLTG